MQLTNINIEHHITWDEKEYKLAITNPFIKVAGTIPKQYSGIRPNSWFFINLHNFQVWKSQTTKPMN